MAEQENKRSPFVTWSGESDRAKAFEISGEAIDAYEGVQSSSASHRSFLDIEPNLSVRQQFTRDDYYRFRTNERIPSQQKHIIKMCMDAYNKVGIIKNIIDLMGDFASQGITLVHPNKKIERFYKKWFQKVGGRERSERFLNILYRCGNVIVKRRTAKVSKKAQQDLSKAADMSIEPMKIIKREIPWVYDFLNPMSVEVIGQELALFAGEPKLALKVSDMIRKMSKKSEVQYYKIVKDLPKDIQHALTSGQKYIELDMEKTSIYYYKKDDWSLWAYPMIYAILDDIVMLEKMKLADMSALDGAISNIRLWKLGDLDHKILPTKAGINKLRNILASNFGGGTMDLVWGPEIDFKESSTQIYRFLGSEKYEPVLTSVYSGLGVPPTLTGLAKSGGGMTNNFISLKTLVERLEYGRQILMGFWKEEIEKVQKAMGFRKPAQLHFDHISLSDEAAEKNLLIQLADRDVISSETLVERFGEIPEIEKIRVSRESRDRNNDKMPKKASPYHNPQHKNDMEKIAYTKDKLSNDDVGLPEEPEVENPEPSIPNEPPRQEEDKRLGPPEAPEQEENYGPVGRPEDGRPKFSKDKQKRKQKRVLPRTKMGADFVNLMLWAMDAQKGISEILNPALLHHYGKKNVRSLTKEHQEELNYIKLGVLSNINPYDNISAELINSILQDGGAVSPEMLELCNELTKEFVSANERKPSATESLQIRSSAYAMCYQK